MSIEVKMPALSPTMETGTLAKWLVSEGDFVKAGDLLAEIETDKATMEFEAVDEGRVARILIGEGTDDIAVGTVIALIVDADADADAVAGADASDAVDVPIASPVPSPEPEARAAADTPPAAILPPAPRRIAPAGRDIASPLAARIAEAKGIDLARITGSGPGGKIVRADLGLATPERALPVADRVADPVAAKPAPVGDAPEIPHEAIKLSNMRKVIARRLTESKQQVPHIYLTVDIRLDALLKLRTELNAELEGRGVKLSVNDMLIKALAAALIEVPSCNVQFAGDALLKFARADISVAVSVPGGLITPIVTDAARKSLSGIATEMKDLAARAREGKLAPHEYQGGTASLSNMGMYAIKQFGAVINPPQAMIMAIGAGEKRPCVIGDALSVATVMSATGSFDHRAIDGADAAALMQAFRALVESPTRILL